MSELISEFIKFESENDVGIITLNRPPHNFLDVDFLTEIADAIDECSSISRCGVIASGVKSFCAGANFTSGSQLDPADSTDFVFQARKLYGQAERLFRSPVPMIAAIDGPAVGAGLGIALACDFIVMADNTWLSANFVRLGIHPGFAISHTLPAKVGLARASEILLTGKRIYSSRAFEIGLVDHLATNKTAVELARELAQEIAQAAPLAVTNTRATLRGDLGDLAAKAMAREVLVQAELVKTEDCLEGISSMLTKRPPRFYGR